MRRVALRHSQHGVASGKVPVRAGGRGQAMMVRAMMSAALAMLVLVAPAAAVACGLVQAGSINPDPMPDHGDLAGERCFVAFAPDRLGQVVAVSGAAGRQASHDAAKRELMGRDVSAARRQPQYTSWPPLTGISAPVT